MHVWSEADRKSPVGREITTYIKMVEPVKVGDHMVDGTLYDTEGNTHHLSEFEGKYILLDFWNLGCHALRWRHFRKWKK